MHTVKGAEKNKRKRNISWDQETDRLARQLAMDANKDVSELLEELLLRFKAAQDAGEDTSLVAERADTSFADIRKMVDEAVDQRLEELKINYKDATQKPSARRPR